MDGPLRKLRSIDPTFGLCSFFHVQKIYREVCEQNRAISQIGTGVHIFRNINSRILGQKRL